MKKPLNKALMLYLVATTGLFGIIQNLYGQSSSLQDSLKQQLTYIAANTKDTALRKAVKEVQAIYIDEAIDDSVSKKLLIVDSLLINNSELNQQLIVSYAQTLMLLLKELPPEQEHPIYAKSLHNLAFLYHQMGQYDKALPLYEQALTIYKKVLGEEHPDYARSLNNLAILYSDMGQYDKALPLHEQALAIRKKVLGEEHPDYARSLNNLAILYDQIGQYDKALPLFKQALAIRKKVLGEEHPDYAKSLNNLALLYSEIGQYDKVLPLHEQALAIRKKVLGEEHPAYAQSLNNLANVYYQMGQYDKALPLYEQALAIYKKVLGEEHPAYAESLSNLANLYSDMRQYDKAQPLYKQALAIKKKVFGEEHPDYAESLSNLANLYSDMGQYDKAQPLYEQALAIYKKVFGEEHPDYAEILSNLAESLNKIGNPIHAASLWSEASTHTLNYLNQTYTTLSEEEKMAFLNNESSRFNYLPSLLFTQNSRLSSLVHQLYTTQLMLKGMVLEDQQSVLRSIRTSGDSTALRLYEQWRSNKSFLGKQLLLPIAKRVPYLDSLTEATTRLEEQLSRRSADFHSVQQSHALTSKDIAQKLQTGEAAVEFISFQLYRNKGTDSTMYAALVLLPQDSNAHFIPLFEERALRHLLASEGNAENTINKLYPGSSTASASLSDSLYQLVWKPLEPYFKDVHTVYFAPTGLLNRVAFGALQVDTSHLLLDKYQLNQVLSTRSVALPTSLDQKPKTASVWGGITYNTTTLASAQHSRGLSSADTNTSAFNLYTWDSRSSRGGGWQPLPYSKEEMDSVKGVLTKAGITVSTSSGTLATEEAFKALDGKSPQVLHLATHGFFLPPAQSRRSELEAGGGPFTVQQNPMFRSGLVLAGGNHTWQGEPVAAGKEDGILTAYEIAQMDLSNTELAVLSACETALGDVQGNEGVIGLQRALKMAGVKQMIMSLWDVPDKTTMELMDLFYQNWLNGQSTREALRSAQLKMKEKYAPYYWAAFVVVE